MNPVLGLQKIRAVVIPLEVYGIVAALMERNGFGNGERVGYDDLRGFVFWIVESINQGLAIALLDFSDQKLGSYTLIGEMELQSLCVLDENSPNDDLFCTSQAIGYEVLGRDEFLRNLELGIICDLFQDSRVILEFLRHNAIRSDARFVILVLERGLNRL